MHSELRRAAKCRDGKTTYREVHALVLEALIGPRPPVAHAKPINGDYGDCRAVNWTWARGYRERVRGERRHAQRSWLARALPSLPITLRFLIVRRPVRSADQGLGMAGLRAA
jgi:hypothetical protein